MQEGAGRAYYCDQILLASFDQNPTVLEHAPKPSSPPNGIWNRLLDKNSKPWRLCESICLLLPREIFVLLRKS